MATYKGHHMKTIKAAEATGLGASGARQAVQAQYEVEIRRTYIHDHRPTSFRAMDEFGDTWRMKLSQLRSAEEVTS